MTPETKRPLRLFDGDTFELDGRTFKFKGEFDQDSDAPWEQVDSLGDVTDWTSRDKGPGERVIVTDRSMKRYYDFAGAVTKARKEGAGAGEGTNGERAVRAVEEEFERFAGWCNDRWHYMGVIVTLLDEEGEDTEERESLWGIEDDCPDYHVDVAYELAGEIVYRLDKERKEREYWAKLEVPTV